MIKIKNPCSVSVRVLVLKCRCVVLWCREFRGFHFPSFSNCSGVAVRRFRGFLFTLMGVLFGNAML